MEWWFIMGNLGFIGIYCIVGFFLSLAYIDCKPSKFVFRTTLMIPGWFVVLILGVYQISKRGKIKK